MNTELKMTAEQVMEARHSVRKYDPNATIPQGELNEILRLAASAPSSWNLQHWRFLVVTDPAIKEKLLPIAYGQQQVVDAYATIIILGDLEANKSAYTIYDAALEKGYVTQEVRDTLIGQIEGAYKNNPEIARDEAIRNSSYAAMQLMLAAKAKGYDTCPMGGYNRDALIKELNIPSRYLPTLMLTIGTASVQAYPTARFGLDELVITNSF
ncbi:MULTISPECIES: nitroreductase family protein [Brevibacillus]|jgi:Nitroreductase|uniref:nitroreductase family protein n=1 Tax=Brevibacillus TaxID=55080 RepID=UPI000EE7021B|nr:MULTISPECIES: nitroreductase family protein [Brevibacillus]MBU8715747.1 nitroreductase family protein [Brevibacillus parabrevis]MDH6352691.1 nitroreductase [Brevibacillus sp. 1238]MDR5001672.1 nitroreductase family protein [Brevibacillus parabrevis]MED1725229.1 nitroreductase family protein [Brevibacillus parabrevis]MED2257950.1 nitroreductase family protein [Brevibacillus parabrevis]